MNKATISLSNTEKITLISNFSTMLTAGISILEAVDALLEDAKGNQKKVLQALREDLIQGKHVYACFAQFPQVFDKVTVNILRASEEAGTLDQTLKDLKVNIQKEMEFSDKVKNAMIYPLVIFVVFLGVMLMILIVVVPKISTVFSRLRLDLPLPTKIMIFISNAILYNTLPLVAGVTVTLGAIVFLYKKNKKIFVNLFTSFPLIAPLVRDIDMTRFTRSLHLLLVSGIPITTALDLTRDVVSRKEISAVIERSRQMVLGGKRLSEGFKGAKKFIPSIVIKMIEAGERSGSLDTAMQDISEFLDYQVSNKLKTLTALLEPIMLVLVGVLIGGMMLAIIAPIYGLVGQINGG
jgi:type IV pilus assembly protein PilC